MWADAARWCAGAAGSGSAARNSLTAALIRCSPHAERGGRAPDGCGRSHQRARRPRRRPGPRAGWSAGTASGPPSHLGLRCPTRGGRGSAGRARRDRCLRNGSPSVTGSIRGKRPRPELQGGRPARLVVSSPGRTAPASCPAAARPLRAGPARAGGSASSISVCSDWWRGGDRRPGIAASTRRPRHARAAVRPSGVGGGVAQRLRRDAAWSTSLDVGLAGQLGEVEVVGSGTCDAASSAQPADVGDELARRAGAGVDHRHARRPSPRARAGRSPRRDTARRARRPPGTARRAR